MFFGRILLYLGIEIFLCAVTFKTRKSHFVSYKTQELWYLDIYYFSMISYPKFHFFSFNNGFPGNIK